MCLDSLIVSFMTLENALRAFRAGGTVSSLEAYSGKLSVPIATVRGAHWRPIFVTALCPGGQERMCRLRGESENNRKAKYYRLTSAGKRRLQAETDKWNRMADVIAGTLHTTPERV
jgi:hypothetical protein